MRSPQLHAYGRSISSPFGLLGGNENAFSFALAATFQSCPELLLAFLKDIGITRIPRKKLQNVVIHLQRRDSQGITDIEVRLPGSFHVIVEAKIGMSIPTLVQCEQYLPRFTGKEPHRKLVALIGASETSFLSRYRTDNPALDEILCGYNWVRILPHCARLISRYPPTTDEGRFIRWFYTFLDREYMMKAFTTEIWILPAGTKPLWPNGWSFLDTHRKRKVYFDTKEPGVRPLYIAFQVKKQITALYRVVNIEHATTPLECAAELARVQEHWPRKPHTVWHIADPIQLPRPIPSGGNDVYRRRVRCDFDVLLDSWSVLEIEQRMKTRRG